MEDRHVVAIIAAILWTTREPKEQPKTSSEMANLCEEASNLLAQARTAVPSKPR